MGEKGAARAAREQKLDRALGHTLGIAMGVRLVPGTPRVERARPLFWVGLWLAGYGAIVLAVLLFFPRSPQGHPQIVSLLAWFGFYFAVAIYLSVATTQKIFDTVRHDIVPNATDEYLDAVAADLEAHFTVRQRIGLPLLVAAISTAAATYAFGQDINAEFTVPGRIHSAPMLLWGASYFLCFYAAAAGVVGAQFHLFFARHLDAVSSRFYALAAAETPIVKGLAKLGTQVLIYWVLIFLAIASCMLVTVLPPDAHELRHTSLLLSTMIPISLFFSLGFGTLVYLASEASIRATLQRFTARQTAALQKRMNDMLFPAGNIVPADTAELDRLIAWHDRITGGGRYGSRIGAAVSITLPLIMPVATLLVKVLYG
jgi:hypothetical protein